MLKVLIYLVFLSLLFISCHPDRFYAFFTIKNNSNKGICYVYSNSYAGHIYSEQ